MADYIVSERMPDDPLVRGKPLEIAKPSFMPNVRFNVLWKFLLDSYNGSLPSEKRFMFKVEALHQNMPAPLPPGDEAVHHTAINSAKTAPLNKAAANSAFKRGRKRKSIPLPSSDDEVFDAAGIAEDEDAALLSLALADPARGRRKRSTRSIRRVESPEASDLDADALPGSGPGGIATPPGGAPSEATSGDEPPMDISRHGFPPGAAELTAKPKSFETGDDLDAERAADNSSPEDKVSLHSTSLKPKPHVRPRPRGTLPPATETLGHSSFPANPEDILNRWKEVL